MRVLPTACVPVFSQQTAECDGIIKSLQETQANLGASFREKQQHLRQLRDTGAALAADLRRLQDTKEQVGRPCPQSPPGATLRRDLRCVSPLGLVPCLPTAFTSSEPCTSASLGTNYVLQTLARLAALQGRAKQLRAVREGRYTRLSASEEALEPAIQRQEERLHTIGTILHRIRQELPQHQGALQRLSLVLSVQLQGGQESV